MTKEHLNEIMAGLCRKLKIRKSDLVAVHEAGLVALGIDSNAIPYGLDFLLLNGAENGTVREFTFDGFDIRLHAPEEFGADESISWTGTLTSLRVGRPRLSDGEDNATCPSSARKRVPTSSKGRPLRAGCISLSSCVRPLSRRPRKSSDRHKTH